MDTRLLNEIKEWVNSGHRQVDIKITNEGTKIYCWDYDLMMGQYIENSISELNLVDKAIEEYEFKISKLDELKKMKEELNG